MRYLATLGGALLILGLASSVASPQNAEAKKDAPLISDRPNESTSTDVLPRLTFQFESGYTFKRRDIDGQNTDSQELPEALFRFGVTSRLEARVQMTGWTFSDTVGDPGFTDGYTHPKLLALIGFALTDRMGLTLNAGPSILRLKDEKNGERTVTDLQYVATVEASANNRIGLFGEFYGAFALNEGRKNRLSCQAGMTVLLARLFQVDTRAGLGLASNVPEWLVGAGLSLRLPH